MEIIHKENFPFAHLHIYTSVHLHIKSFDAEKKRRLPVKRTAFFRFSKDQFTEQRSEAFVLLFLRVAV